MKAINPERARLWIDALRSDSYAQTRGQFIDIVEHVAVGHCCLAVATDVAIRNGCDDVRWGKDSDGDPIVLRLWSDDDGPVEDYDSAEQDDDGNWWVSYSDGDMPPEVGNWYGIEGPGSRCNPDLHGVFAIQRNDEQDDTFEDIADAIEADLAQMMEES